MVKFIIKKINVNGNNKNQINNFFKFFDKFHKSKNKFLESSVKKFLKKFNINTSLQLDSN